jgi:hypothetical protein
MLLKGNFMDLFNQYLIIRNDTQFYLIYNLFQALSCIISSFMYAYLAAFGPKSGGSFNGLEYFDIIFSTIFSIDIFLRFFITYEDNDCRKVKTIKEIAMNYIKTELIFDIITVLPLMRIIKP